MANFPGKPDAYSEVYLLANIGFDTADNDTPEVLFLYFSHPQDYLILKIDTELIDVRKVSRSHH